MDGENSAAVYRPHLMLIRLVQGVKWVGREQLCKVRVLLQAKLVLGQM